MFTLAVCLFCTASLTAQNLLINPSFETGEIVPWTFGNGDTTVMLLEDATQGMYGCRGNIEQLVQVTAGVTYTYSADVKCLAGCGENMWIGIKDVTGDAFVANSSFTDVVAYEERTITFTAGTTGTHRFWVFGQGDADYISDNFLLLAEGTTDVTEVEAELNKIEITNNAEGVMVSIDESINDATIEIYNIAGQEIYRGQALNGTTLINKSEFSTTGIYVVSVRTDKALKSEKVSISLN